MSNAGNADASPSVSAGDIEDVIGPAVCTLIRIIAGRARDRSQTLYLVGGLVRDVLLGRGQPDLDFALEADAIAFSHELARRYGGGLAAHRHFGTATWMLDENAAEQLQLPYGEIRHRIDFVRTRSEHYGEPAALPKVHPGQIEDDMRRRDFSINALALQLSPKRQCGRLIDICGGFDDLRAKRMRVLHKRSFVDDPTRILRAIRFAVRLGFKIDEPTELWMRAALPLLGRVSGARLRNELDRILCESRAGDMLLRLQETGALEVIHPAFRIGDRLPALLARSEASDPPWKPDAVDTVGLNWILMLHNVGAANAGVLCERLQLSKALTTSIVECAKLTAPAGGLNSAKARPSQLSRLLEKLPESALRAAWLLSEDEPLIRERIAEYMLRWRHRRATITGNDLMAMGLPPGPMYRSILDQLRDAWIDGEVQNASEQRALLGRLLQTTDE